MRFHIENMTCGHCERSIRQAIAARWPQANLVIDLRGRTVDIDGGPSAAEFVATLAQAGYSAIRITELA